MNTHNFQDRLLHWYRQHQRNLPWRQTQDPYAIWVSEIMLQQTQVDTVIPYYDKWMKRFPNIQALAESNLNSVLSLWAGLGYYARARNLYRASQWVVEKTNGRVPSQSKLLMELPGIGPYSAHAIASIAFKEKVAVVDGNVHRVISRLLNIEKGKNEIQLDADRLLDQKHPGDFNQAMMDLGATICLVQNPLCLECPVQLDCAAFKMGVQNLIPRPAKLTKQRKMLSISLWLLNHKRILLHRRALHGLLGGLWEFPTIHDISPPESLKLLTQELDNIGIAVKVGNQLSTDLHIYTHIKEKMLTYNAIYVGGRILKRFQSDWKWAEMKKHEEYPLTGICRKIYRKLLAFPHKPTQKQAMGPPQTVRSSPPQNKPHRPP